MKSSASLRARLKNIADTNKIDFQSCITRYFHVRLLYRISVSEYRNQFLLKGGNLIYAMYYLQARPTIDIDLLGKELKNASIVAVFKKIIAIDFDDAVWFNPGSIKEEVISERNRYHGIRLIIESGFDTIKQNIQIDIGFGDKVTPKPAELSYPNLLEDLPAPILLAYTTETVIAEKFQTMIELSDFNSRMKDFYDVFTILNSKKYNKAILKDAVLNTFKNRNTKFIDNHNLFSDEYASDNMRNTMWIAFLKKIAARQDYEFSAVIDIINKELYPVWLLLKEAQ